MRYLLDTDTCADILRGRPDVVARLRRVSPDEIAISTISVYELHAGIERCRHPDRERAKLDILLNTVHVVPFLEQTSRRAARVRADLDVRGCPIGPYDILIAGQALSAGLILVTGNQREFNRVVGLHLENWRDSR